VDTIQIAVGDGQVASDGSSSSEDNSVILLAESLEVGLAILPNGDTGLEVDTLGSHKVNTTLNNLLVKLHVGDTVHEQTTDAVSTFIYGDSVASLVKLISTSQTSRAGTDDGNSLARTSLRWRRDHPALLETTVNDGALNRLDAYGVLVDAKNTSTLARSRANTTGELGEVVGHKEAIEGVAPLALED
jgi:hypothetical protein